MHLMIDAVEEVSKVFQKFKVVIIGLETEQMHEPIQQRGLTKYFHIVGEVPVEIDPETNIPRMPSQIIIDHLCAADVFISPALSGGFELSAMDAMSAGLAVILSDNIGNKDLVKNGVNGFVYENNNPMAIAESMISLLKDTVKTRTMGEYNKNMAADYSWAKVAEAYENAYKVILSKWNK
jgi:glycosyltransferase involved in cell wall biosynthesis